MTLKELRELLYNKFLRLKELRNLIKTEDRSFEETEEKEVNELLEACERLEAEIEEKEKAEKKQAERLDKIGNLEQRFNTSTTNPVRVEVTREHNHDQEGEYRGFKVLGEQLAAIAAEHNPNLRNDPRLGEMRAASGANTIQGSEGGFAIQSDFEADLVRKTFEKSVLAPKCRQKEISAASNKLTRWRVKEDSRADGSRNGGVRVYRTEEAGTITGTNPELEEDSIELKKLAALYIPTEELLQDAVALQSEVMDLYPEEMAFTIDNEIVRGNGTSQMLGILNSSALVTKTKETSQTADTLVYENIAGVQELIHAPSYARGEWYANQFCRSQLDKMYVSGSNSDKFVYIPEGGISGRPYATLGGRPVNFIEQASALGDKGDIFFADLSEYEVIKKGGIQTAGSIHVYFVTAQQAFRFIYRINGRPRWHQALTPFKGASGVKVSPFGTVAERA